MNHHFVKQDGAIADDYYTLMEPQVLIHLTFRP